MSRERDALRELVAASDERRRLDPGDFWSALCRHERAWDVAREVLAEQPSLPPRDLTLESAAARVVDAARTVLVLFPPITARPIDMGHDPIERLRKSVDALELVLRGDKEPEP